MPLYLVDIWHCLEDDATGWTDFVPVIPVAKCWDANLSPFTFRFWIQKKKRRTNKFLKFEIQKPQSGS